MRWLILAVLLAIAQTPSPVSQQGANNPNGGRNASQKQLNPSQTPSAPTHIIPEATTAKKDEASPREKQNADDQKTVSISKLPSVSVESGWRDSFGLFLTFILVAVTALQAYLLCRTLQFVKVQSVITRRQTRHIARQALSMRRQTTHLKNSVIQAAVAANAAKLSADALVASQRAWLDGEFQVPSGVQDTWGTWNLVAKNHGATPAQLVRHECSFHAEGQEFGWDSGDQKDTRIWGMLIGAGQYSEPLQTIKPDSFFAYLRERGKKGAAGCTIGITLVYVDVINPKVEHVTRFLMLYNRVSKHIERLSQYNEYT
jgi:hypothetical protein